MTEDTVGSPPDTQYHEVTLAEVLGIIGSPVPCPSHQIVPTHKLMEVDESLLRPTSPETGN